MVNALKRVVAKDKLGFVNKYRKDTNKKAGMFSKSFKCALL
jgi:hypothetical protein